MPARPFGDPADVTRALALAYSTADEQPPLLDLPYRFCSPALFDNPAQDTRRWEDERGTLLAYTIWQAPFVTLDHATHPQAPADLADEVIAWATARFASHGRERGVRLPYWCEARPAWAGRRAMLARHGFAPALTWQLPHLRQSLDHQPPAPDLPAGYIIRPLAGEGEVATYVAAHRAAFDSTAMTVEWRRTRGAPGYRPDLDLVIAAPDGHLAAFCIACLAPDEFATGPVPVGQIEPLGVHPAFHHLGLGRAILLAALHRLRATGATGAAIDAYDDNPTARQLYESVGFRTVYARAKWRREF